MIRSLEPRADLGFHGHEGGYDHGFGVEVVLDLGWLVGR